MYVIYSVLTAAGMVLLSPYFLIRGLIRGKEVSNIPERLGWKFPKEMRDPRGSKEMSIWIHAVSVGEVLAVLPLATQLKQRYPQRRMIISTTTTTGQQLARERMKFADAVFYFPLDWAGPMRRALRATQASILIIVETEIWPNCLRECRRARVPVVFVNGRLSEQSSRGFHRALFYSGGMLRDFLGAILNDAAMYLMQGAGDAERLHALGAPEERIIVAGNLKYDLAEPPETALATWLATELVRCDRGPVVIAGSVMAGEEDSVLKAFAEVEREFPKALLILAPRKPQQFDSAAAIVMQAGRKIVRRRDILLHGADEKQLNQTGSVFLLDSLGELASVYRLADAVFVGGSLTPNGGHNILEPAAFGKVPVHGPSMENFREMAANFMQAGAAICVNDADELGSGWRDLLRDPERAARMGTAARELVERNRGATARVLAHLEEILGAPGSRA